MRDPVALYQRRISELLVVAGGGWEVRGARTNPNRKRTERNDPELKDASMLLKQGVKVRTRKINHVCCIAQAANGNGELRMQVDVLTPKAVFAPPSGFSVGEGLEEPSNIVSAARGQQRRGPVKEGINKDSGQTATHGDATRAAAQSRNGIRRLVRITHLGKLVRATRVVAEAEVFEGKTL